MSKSCSVALIALIVFGFSIIALLLCPDYFRVAPHRAHARTSRSNVVVGWSSSLILWVSHGRTNDARFNEQVSVL